ncbi:hypothetical protein BGZ76_008693 [Entomortierella beljakovae]|nr:hypothetical protein BGZ76_008693 [Entomortierella beljakovae]
MPPEPSNQPIKYESYLRDLRTFEKSVDVSSAMTQKSQFVPSETSLSSNDDEILHQRHIGTHAGAVGSSQLDTREKDGTSSRNSPVELSEEIDVAARLEQKRLEHERQRTMKRELFEQQMQQLEIQQMQEEQAMLANNKKHGSNASSVTTEPSQGLNSIRSLPVSRRNSNDGASDLWGDMEKMSINEKVKRPTDLSKIGKSATTKEETTSPSESAFGDNTHLSKFAERFIFDDDNAATSGSGLSSLQRNIWNDQQGLGAGSSAIASASYLPRYLQMGADDDETFPTLRSSSSSALDLAQIPHTSGLRHPSSHDLSRNSEWPQFNKAISPGSDRLPAVPQHGGSIIGFGGISGSDDPLKSPLPKLTPSYSSSEISTRFNKPPSLKPFDDLPEGDHHGIIKSESSPSDTCLQFQQGYCPRGDMCPFVHTTVSRAPVGTPLSPGLGSLSVGGLTNGVGSTSFYSRMGSVSGAGSMSSLTAAATGFPFNTISSGSAFDLPSSGASNALRMQQQPQQSVGNIANPKGSAKQRPVLDADANRFAGAVLEGFIGQIYSLCKDQHGCRYLQKKLEEQNDAHLAIIFGEVFGHFVELMTDPFGNYLCQKLLEYCGDEQRTAIVDTVAPELVNISLNMHGTRAVQKMIEFLSTPEQIAIVVVALNPSVVTLIKDLNGNHVIQKCLNRLASEDNQFIYNAISAHCVEVATHRHGCCVLQRCIDHASASQKIQLVRGITFNALALVQDPFGNYVVQYVLDLADNRFTDALIRRFIGSVCLLSVQKFSSNVIEKCIRVAEPETRKFLIEEMVNKARLDKLLRDSYANYVVQTALEFADPIQRAQLVECIRPLLPAIRNTPYGKRIQSKLHRDQMSSVSQLNHINMSTMGVMGPMNNMNNMSGLNGMGNMGNMGSMNGMGMNNMNNMNGMNGMNGMGGMPNGMAMNMANMANNMNGLGHMNPMSMSNMGNMNNMGNISSGINTGNMKSMGSGGPNNISGMNNIPNNLNGNMMGFGFPGMSHFGNVGMIVRTTISILAVLRMWDL